MEIMKTTFPIFLVALILCGCASEKNPLMTGNPKDWRGHPTSDLVTASGQPTRVLQQSDGEVWQYIKQWDAEVPKGSHMSFNMQGFSTANSSVSGAGGGFESHEQYKAHYVRIDSFAVKKGIITKWYGEIDENDQAIRKWH